MTPTETAPAPARTVQRGLPLGHAVCFRCHPDTPAPGDVALCGHVCLGIIAPRGTYQECLVCEALEGAHYAAHRKEEI